MKYKLKRMWKNRDRFKFRRQQAASLVFHGPPVIMWIIRNLIAWSPTYLLLIGWRHYRPDETRTAFVKRCFSGKVELLPLLFSFALTFGISVLSLFIFSAMTGKPMLSYINLGTTALPLSIFLSLTSEPTGEELGWRGFMREEFNKKYGFLKSSVCQGLVWCFWHTLIWVVDSEFTDWRAIPYVISNYSCDYIHHRTDEYFSGTAYAVLERNKAAERLLENNDSGERKIGISRGKDNG